MARINMERINVTVAQDTTGRMLAASRQRANEVFEDAVIGMQVDFEDHVVTQEIDGGLNSANISDTLGGGSAPKNLYSFIGFSAEDPVSPLEPIRDALDPSSAVGKAIGPKMRYVGKEVRANRARFKFDIAAPNKEAIYKATPLPWAPGLSWAQKIETRIPGFQHFLSKFMGDPSQSRGGIQAKDPAGNLVAVRSEEYRAPSGGYLTGIVSRFLSRVGNYRAGGLNRRFK